MVKKNKVEPQQQTQRSRSNDWNKIVIINEKSQISTEKRERYLSLIARILKGDTPKNWESTLKEKIFNSLRGIGTYDELSKSDIDSLIEEFKKIQETFDD